jgi:hypothetical protein
MTVRDTQLAGTKHRTRGNQALIVSKIADETPQGWYCACCSAPEPPMPMYMFLYARFSPCQDRNRFLDSHGMAGRAMQGQLPKNQSHVLISSPPTSPTASRLEHEGSALGLLVTAVSQCQNPYAKRVRESCFGGTAVPSLKGPELHTEEGWCDWRSTSPRPGPRRPGPPGSRARE